MIEKQYLCRNCKGLRNHQVLFEIKKRGGDDDDFFHWIRNFVVIECLGCENISFLEIYGDNQMIAQDDNGNYDYYYDTTIYPYYLDKGYELDNIHYLPETIRIIYKETISALKASSYILTAGGLRAIIEAVCNHLNIKQDNLAERIDLLNKQGYLTLNESKRLHSIRFLGNDALHEIEKPKKDQLYILLEIVNHLLSNLFINDNKIKGKMDTIIDKFDDYIRLVQNKITQDMVSKEFTINQILGKSKRLIPNKNFKEFEDKLKKNIKLGKYDFITMIVDKEETTYKIEKVPDLSFDW